MTARAIVHDNLSMVIIIAFADRDTKKLVADLRKRISQLESELVQIKSREAHSKLKESLSITREFYKG